MTGTRLQTSLKSGKWSRTTRCAARVPLGSPSRRRSSWPTQSSAPSTWSRRARQKTALELASLVFPLAEKLRRSFIEPRPGRRVRLRSGPQ